MNIAIALVIGAALTGAGEQNEGASKEVRAALLRLNEAFAKEDAEAIRSLMTDDHVAILSVGVRQTKEEALRTLADFKFSAYVTEDLQVTMLRADVALATFRAKIEGTFRGRSYPQDNLASALWVRQGGRWLERYYQETAVPRLSDESVRDHHRTDYPNCFVPWGFPQPVGIRSHKSRADRADKIPPASDAGQ